MEIAMSHKHCPYCNQVMETTTAQDIVLGKLLRYTPLPNNIVRATWRLNRKSLTVSDLIKFSRNDLLLLPWIGESTVKKVESFLKSYELKLNVVDSYEP